MEYVKICGLKQYEHIQVCIDNGADAIGFIYNVPTSPRNLQKSEIKEFLEKINNIILTVIVLKPVNVHELEDIMKEIGSTYFQIHIDFDFQELDQLPREYKEKIILAIKVNQANKESVIEQINKLINNFFAFLIDNSEGQGNELNLDIIGDILKETTGARIIVAGGIKIENVESIIKNFKPYGIDVSSSLEVENGLKDPKKIKDFLRKIKEIKNSMRE